MSLSDCRRNEMKVNETKHLTKTEQKTFTKQEKDYWKARCVLAEKFIKESPCDPDVTTEQWKAYMDWQYYKDR